MNETILKLLEEADEANYSFVELMACVRSADLSGADEESRLVLATTLIGILLDEMCEPEGILKDLSHPERALAQIASAIHGNNPMFYLDNTMTMAGVLMGTGEVQIGDFAAMVKRAYAVAEDVRARVLLDQADTSNPQ